MQLEKRIGDIIKTIAVDKDGVIWVGHLPHDKLGYLGGITKFDGARWNIVELSGIPNDKLESIEVDQDNFKWFCTENGLGKYKIGNTLLVFSTKNAGILSNHIKSIHIDKSGDLWVATYGGGLEKLKKGNF
jgi:ligand-binding sensor domain-containing protein